MWRHGPQRSDDTRRGLSGARPLTQPESDSLQWQPPPADLFRVSPARAGWSAATEAGRRACEYWSAPLEGIGKQLGKQATRRMDHEDKRDRAAAG